MFLIRSLKIFNICFPKYSSFTDVFIFYSLIYDEYLNESFEKKILRNKEFYRERKYPIETKGQ